MELDEEDYINWKQFNIDCTNILADQSTADARKINPHAGT